MGSFIVGLRGVRYQVADVSRSIDFYTKQLGFKLEAKHLPAFAEVSVGDLRLILSGPAASGSRPARWPPPLKKAGLHFRNQLEEGPGGKQVQLEDPDGNPLELFEPAH